MSRQTGTDHRKRLESESDAAESSDANADHDVTNAKQFSSITKLLNNFWLQNGDVLCFIGTEFIYVM
jgi:hypothetical protein